MIAEPDDRALRALMQQVARARGFPFDAYKQGCLRRRLAVRMRARSTHTYQQYGALLDREPAEYDRLLAAFTINVSRFFRNPETWEAIVTHCFPRLWERRRDALLCWSAGCAGGEEPYSLALLLADGAARRGLPQPSHARIDATDYDSDSLRAAERGRYSAQVLRDVPLALRRAYFHGTDPGELAPQVRRLVRFQLHDVIRDPAPSPAYDLVLFRNVAIYFDRAVQETVLARVAAAVAPGGFLVLGKVETLRGPARGEMQLEVPRERIYRRL